MQRLKLRRVSEMKIRSPEEMMHMKLRRECALQKHDQIKSGPLDTQAPDQRQGWIVERKRRIKQRVIPNPTISLDRQITREGSLED
jgi:hypothetical protein